VTGSHRSAVGQPNTASDGIRVLDTEGLLVEANDAFLNMLGYDRTAIARLRVSD
jgi:PAS domain-containing protein